MLTIAGKALGRKKPLFADFSVPPPGDMEEGSLTTLREIISIVVRHEVASFQQRQQDRQFLRALTAGQIAEGAEAGKIESGLSEVERQAVNEEHAVANALVAFEDGLYLVVVDDQEHRDLDAVVYLRPDSRLTFIRLTMLAGG